MSAAPDLVLEGRIAAIEPFRGSGSSARWLVRLAVERVIAGEFSGSAFEFAVHSPAKSGLALGQTIRLIAKKTAQGYTVDPLQWLPGR